MLIFVREVAKKGSYRRAIYACPCCGVEKERTIAKTMPAQCIKCFNANKPRTGFKVTKLYNVWVAFRQRCTNPNNKGYKNYGARGVSVCKEWDSFPVFEEWAYANGYVEDAELSIDREDNDGDYTPDNCRWVDRYTQNVNRRSPNVTNGKLKGAYKRKRKRKGKDQWFSNITIHGTTVHLGTASSEEGAARLYDKYIIDNNLPHTTNFEQL